MASNLDESLKGQYKVTVEAKDGEEPVHRAQTVLSVSVTPNPWPRTPRGQPSSAHPWSLTQIFTVDQSYRVRLQFVTTVEEVQSNSENIKL